MNDEDQAIIVEKVLRGLGLQVDSCPRTNRKSPDFICRDPESVIYVVEAKTKNDSDEFQQMLAEGALASQQMVLDAFSGVAVDLSKAAGQLRAAPESREGFSLIGYVVAGSSPEMQARQVRATLFGTKRLMDAVDPSFAVDCFYFGRAFFAEHPEVDGLLMIDPSVPGLGLYPNRFSTRRIEASFLGRSLELTGAVFSPEEAVAHGAGLLADTALPDERERLRELQKRTGRRTLQPGRCCGYQARFRLR